MSVHGMLENIRAHSIVVARIAELIAGGVKNAGHPISLELTLAAALLHDIGKTPCLNTLEDHARKGSDICRSHQLDTIADIVAEHVVLKNGVPLPVCTEKEIVYYADKRVNHDAIVDLDDRLDYIIERYAGENAELKHAIRKNFKHCHLIESILFADLDFRPGDIVRLVHKKQSILLRDST
ncbi:MAG: HD domain-containing protein [Desulfobulbaceae bacterium]|nr:HD domain-containing protein [Desulfobulbaceae bacterium]